MASPKARKSIMDYILYMDCTVFRELMLNPCKPIQKKDAIQMIAVLELVFALGYIFHGIFILTAMKDNFTEDIYGIIYIICGASYLLLTILLWIIGSKSKTNLCKWWIIVSILAQLTILSATICRNVFAEKWLYSVCIWIFGGLFLQIYMLWIVWAFMKDEMVKLKNNTTSSHQQPKEIES